MVGKEQLLGHLLRILTPEELSNLTSTSSGRNLISLTDMLCEKISEVEEQKNLKSAKILPFTREKDKENPIVEEVEFDQYTCGKKVKSILDDYIKRLSIKDSRFSKNCPTKQESTNFIIQEKERFIENYSKIKSKEVLNLYEKNSSIDIEREKNKKDNPFESSDLGVLINKKQA